MSSKHIIRKEMIEKRKALSPTLRAQYDHAICENILSLQEVKNADAICMYFSDGTEPLLDSLIQPFQKMNKILYFPRFDSTDVEGNVIYQMIALHPNKTPIIELGKWNLRELSTSIHNEVMTSLKPHKQLLWLIPGVAFSAQGARLGRGKAIYDQLLFAGYKVGIFYSFQAVESLPEEPHDRRLNAVITENITLRFLND